MKIEVDITEADIKQAIERKVRVAVAQYAETRGMDIMIHQAVLDLAPKVVDDMVRSALADAPSIKKAIMEKIERQINIKVRKGLS